VAAAAFVPVSDRARWAVVALVAAVIVDAVAVVSDLAELSLLARVEAGDASDAEVAANDLRQGLIGLLQLVLLVVTAVLFIRWFHRAYSNLDALGRERRWATWWAIGGWFIPIWNLFRPKQIANDVWRASSPAGDDDPPALYALWWTAWLASLLVGNAAARLLFGAEEIGELRAAATAYTIADAASVVAGVLAILVVRRTTERHDAAGAARAADEQAIRATDA